MSDMYNNIELAPAILLDDHAEDIAIPNFPEIIQLHMNVHKPGEKAINEKHWHRTFQFNVVFEGELRININDTSVILKEGEGIFINKGVLHCLMPTANSTSLSLSLLVPVSAICSENDIPTFEKYVSPVINSEVLTHLVFKLSDYNSCKIIELLRDIAHAAEHQEFAYEFKIKSAIAQLWPLLLEYISKNGLNEVEADHVLSASAERMKDMMSYIQENYKEKLSLGDIAKSANVSTSECNRAFRRFLDITPIDYLNKVRIVQACTLLRDKNAKASIVGEAVGFLDYSYFYRVFKKYMDCTPKEYQKLFFEQKQK